VIVRRTGFGPVPWYRVLLVRVVSSRVAREVVRLRRLDEAAAGGDLDRLGAVVGAELGEDGADVELDGPLGDEEPFGDLPVSQPPEMSPSTSTSRGVRDSADL
jgi:hypothetical protein